MGFQWDEEKEWDLSGYEEGVNWAERERSRELVARGRVLNVGIEGGGGLETWEVMGMGYGLGR